MSGQDATRPAFCDRLERLSPFERVALHLVGIARVRHRRDDQIADHRQPPRRHPDPGRVIRLAHRVMQFDRLARQVKKLFIAINQVGVAERLGAEESLGSERAAELEPIDMPLPSAGQRVAFEAGGDVGVRPDFRPRMPARERVGNERRGAEGVIAVAMRIDEKRERLLADLANRAHRHRAHQLRAGIDDDYLAAPVCERDVGEAVEHRDSRLEHFELSHQRVEARQVVRLLWIGGGTHDRSPADAGRLRRIYRLNFALGNEG